jgi:hypothetical protein
LDLQGAPYDPICVQPYDDAQKPIYRHPDGRLVTRELAPVGIDTKLFSKSHQPLDFYLRPLPPNAVAMFAANPREPIGVGVDGKHYAYPSGREYSEKDPHFDAEGQPLPPDTIKAANMILPALKIACIVQSSNITREKGVVFDAFGRRLNKTKDGKLLTREGAVLGANAAIFDAVGSRIKYKPDAGGAVKTLEIVYITNENKVVVLGKLGIEVGQTTLAHVHSEIKKSMGSKVSSITFLVKGAPIPDREREQR